MSYKNEMINNSAELLHKRLSEIENKTDILKSVELKNLYAVIPTLPKEQRADFGREVNLLKQELASAVSDLQSPVNESKPIDITAPMDVNSPVPELFSSAQGSIHPLTKEISVLADIFQLMGFHVEESREIDDQFNMFESLNFPKGHPARDDWDTFMTVETDKNGDPYIAPAHTSTMQNRVLKKYKENLEKGDAIAVVIPDRAFRNEDLDARHGHTFYQIEGIYVGKNVHAGMLIATLQEFLQQYFGKKLDVRVNPFYFPFTEPSFEFALSCPFCDGKKPSCKVCSGEGWVELLGCGMIHPNVLKAATIDPETYTGFAFGCGIDRLVMLKYGIEDIRYFLSGKLEFLRQFS